MELEQGARLARTKRGLRSGPNNALQLTASSGRSRFQAAAEHQH